MDTDRWTGARTVGEAASHHGADEIRTSQTRTSQIRTSRTRTSRRSPEGKWAFLLILLMISGIGSARGMEASAARPPHRVLVLYSGNRLLPANLLFDESLRESFASSVDTPIECCGEFLDEARFPVGYEERMSDLIREKYGVPPADAIIAFASPSLGFCLRHQAELFKGVPIVFAGLGSDTLGTGRLAPGVTGVRSTFDGPATLRLALRLHPRTRQVYVITGAAGGDPDSAGAGLSRQFASEFRVTFHPLIGQPLSRLLNELSGLPPNSVVVDLSGFESSGDPVTQPFEAMRRMSDVSRAPIYSVLDPLVGYGLVGAVTTPMDEIGHATATLVLQVVSRGDSASLPAVRSLASTPLVDWRQMRRWGVRTSQLPPGVIVRFEPPSFWRQHLLLFVTTGILFLLQSGLILALVLQSRRRRRAEIEARHRREELEHMTRVATMGELAASLAHEINQPLAAILSNAQAAQRLMSTENGNPDEIREILADIAADDRRAGEVIRRMRALLRKGESNPSELDMNEVVDEVVGIVRGELILHNVSLVQDLSPRRLTVQGDRVQLQQVLLNLLVNALDALRETTGGDGRIVIRTAPAPDDQSVQVSVQDNGPGVPPEKIESIFDPFTTTKSNGLGLGLAICRSIIQSHGGRIGSRNNADRGVTFWFTLPALFGARK